MASPSSSSSSHLNSTCGLLSFLNLNDKHSQSMENMDTECVVDVPDTPDRLAARQIVGGQFSQRETNSSLSCSLRTSDLMMENRMNSRKELEMLVNDNGHNSKLVSSPKNLSSDDVKGKQKSIILSPKENSLAPQNNLPFRRPRLEMHSCQRVKPFVIPRRMDKGINTAVDSLSKLPSSQESAAAPNIREHDHKLKSQMVSRHVTIKDHKTENTSKEQFSSSVPNVLKKPSISIKGKEKVIDISPHKGVEKSNDTNDRYEKQALAPIHSVVSPIPRTTGQKRLVRNGCISPHNIAAKTKKFAARCDKSYSTLDQFDLGNSVSSSSPSLIDIKDIVAEENHGNRGRGKGDVFFSRDDDVRIIHKSSRDDEKSFGENPAGTSRMDSFECSERIGGWRKTHNFSRKAIELSDPSRSSYKKIENVVRCANGRTESMERQVTSRQELKAERSCAVNTDTAQRAATSLTERKFNKRQRKHGSASDDNSSCLIPDVEILNSLGESSNSRSTRLQCRRTDDDLNDVIEINEVSPGIIRSISRVADCRDDDNSDARARQVEADEMLARELQEQLYQEMPVGGVEIDGHIAMALQQVEDGVHASSRQQHNVNRRPQSESVESVNRRGSRAPVNRSTRTNLEGFNRRANRAPVTRSARMAQLRNQFFGGSHRVSSRQRNINFPMHMDLEMRLDILEALETAVGGMEDVMMSNSILNTQRDFNENDYEMLLALDENNHQHAGASNNRINSLPQSTVQTENTEEACAICLEAPSMGEVIRHLPCLHKFHKNCIDPWLQRRTSCPVCKLSIT